AGLRERVGRCTGKSGCQSRGETRVGTEPCGTHRLPAPGGASAAGRLRSLPVHVPVSAEALEVPAHRVLVQSGDLDELCRRGTPVSFELTQETLARGRMRAACRGAARFLAGKHFHGINYS